MLAVLLLSARAEARIVINVDKTQQSMTVVVDGIPRYRWDVSTGRENFSTPTGVFMPQRLERSWFSRKYYDSPMPHSIFFHRGYAIHGSYDIRRLGGPASHGCVRLHPQNAATLFALVRQEGAGNTTIVVSGDSGLAAARRAPRYRYVDDSRAVIPRTYSRRSYIREDEGWDGWGRPARSFWR